MKKKLSLVLATLMLLGLLAGCGGQPAASGDKDTVVVYIGDIFNSMTPYMTTANSDQAVFDQVYETLTVTKDDGTVAPCLAKSWKMSDDSLEYTFQLEEGVKFHNGEVMTADDVVYSFEQYLANPAKNNFVSMIDKVEMVDANTVKVTLNKVTPLFLVYINELPILNKKFVEEHNGNISDVACGTGPYKLESWDVGQSIVLVKNENYYLGAPHIDRILFKIVPDDNAQAVQLKSGELDLALLDPKNAQNFQNTDGFTCYDMKTSDYRGILFNFWNEYWQNNRDIIPAVCYAIDRQAIIDTVLLGQGMAAYGPLQRNIYNNENGEHYDYNPEKAREILENAGCTLNSEGYYERNGEEIGFVISVMSGEQDRLDIAQAAAQQLRQAGIHATVEIPAQMDWGGQMACLIGWGSPFDADDHTYKVFGTDKGANYSSYSNEKVDEYLSLARQSDDPEVRKEYYGKFQEELAEDPAYAFICYIDANYVADSGIQGISKDTVLGHHGVGIFWNIQDWTIEE